MVMRGRRLNSMDPSAYRERLRAQVQRHVGAVSADGCWLWAGAIWRNGYGQTRCLGRSSSAHRASYFAFVGPIPDGMEVCHRCDVRRCVNPDHLFVATHAENMRDQREKGRARNGVMSGSYEPSRSSDGRFVCKQKEDV